MRTDNRAYFPDYNLFNPKPFLHVLLQVYSIIQSCSVTDTDGLPIKVTPQFPHDIQDLFQGGAVSTCFVIRNNKTRVIDTKNRFDI